MIRRSALSALCCRNFTASSVRSITFADSEMDSCAPNRRLSTSLCRSVKPLIARTTSLEAI